MQSRVGGQGCSNPPWGSSLLRVGLPSWGESRHPPQLNHRSSTPIRVTQGGFCEGICWKKTCTHKETIVQIQIEGHPAKKTGLVSSQTISTAGQTAPIRPPHGSGNFSELKFFELATSGGKRTQGLLSGAFTGLNGPLWERLGHPHSGAFPGLQTSESHPGEPGRVREESDNAVRTARRRKGGTVRSSLGETEAG